jgi:hypothetical protein
MANQSDLKTKIDTLVKKASTAIPDEIKSQPTQMTSELDKLLEEAARPSASKSKRPK